MGSVAVLLEHGLERIIWLTARRTRPLSITRSNNRCFGSVSQAKRAISNLANMFFMNAFSRAYGARFAKY